MNPSFASAPAPSQPTFQQGPPQSAFQQGPSQPAPVQSSPFMAAQPASLIPSEHMPVVSAPVESVSSSGAIQTIPSFPPVSAPAGNNNGGRGRMTFHPDMLNQLQMSPMGDKFLLSGDATLFYKHKLAELGGKYFKSPGLSGWSFPVSHKDSVEQLIAAIRSGQITPLTNEELTQDRKQKKQKQKQFLQQQQMQQMQPMMVPQGFVPYFQQPQQQPQFFQQPQQNQFFQQPQQQNQFFQQPAPFFQQQTPFMQPNPMFKQPKETRYQIQGNYQTVTFKVYRPSVGNSVKVKVQGSEYMGSVSSVQTNKYGYVYSCVIQVGANSTELQVVDRKWKVKGFTQNHSVFFE